MAADLEWSRMQSLVGGASKGKIGVAAFGVVQSRFREMLRELSVTTEELRELSKRAGAGRLKFFGKVVGSKDQRRVDITLLVSEKAAWNLASWVNEMRDEGNAQPVLGIPTNDAAPARAPPPAKQTAPPVKAEDLRAKLTFGTRSAG